MQAQVVGAVPHAASAAVPGAVSNVLSGAFFGTTPRPAGPLLGELAGVLFLVVLIEAAWQRFGLRRSVEWRGVAASMADALVRRSVDLAGLTLAAPVPAFAFAHRLATIPMHGVARWAGLFLLVEFAYYWHHRAAHRVRWFWATHSVHHSSNELMLASAIRLGWTGRLGGALLFYSPLVWIGFPPQAVFGLVTAGLFYQFWIHADWLPRLGPFEWVLNTPAHHRVHHASNAEYLDCNYGSVLIVFDRLFGSFVAERDDIAIRYGLVHPVRSHNPVRIAFDGWLAMGRAVVAARGVRARLGVLFGPP